MSLGEKVQLTWLHEEPFDFAGNFYREGRAFGRQGRERIAGETGKALVSPSGAR